MGEDIVFLEDWSIVQITESPYQAPELARSALYGKAFGHPRFEDAQYVTTGTIQKFDSETMTAETNRTKYKLGKMADQFRKYLDDENIELSRYDGARV